MEPFSADDLFTGLVTAEALALAGVVLLRWWVPREWRMLALALGWKLGAAVASAAIPWFYYLPEFINDNITYYLVGADIAAAVRRDGWPELAGQVGAALAAGAGGIATDRFYSASGLLQLPVGDSYLGVTLLCAALGFVGQVLLYRTFVELYPAPRLRVWWQLGILFFPSLVYWSAGLYKDSLGILGLGLAVWGVHRFVRDGSLPGVLVAALGGDCLALYRAQVLPALCAALVPWMLFPITAPPAERRRAAYRQAALAGVAVLGLAGVFLAESVDTRLALTNLPAAVLEQIQRAEQRVFAGSNLDAPRLEDVSWQSLAAAAGPALVVSLFRPFPWEASGVLGLLAALENAVLLALCARAAWQLLVRRSVFLHSVRSPVFWAGVLFTGVLGVAVGVTQPNLGTVSRYRIPLLPFVVTSLVIVEDAAARGTGAAARAVRD